MKKEKKEKEVLIDFLAGGPKFEVTPLPAKGAHDAPPESAEEGDTLFLLPTTTTFMQRLVLGVCDALPRVRTETCSNDLGWIDAPDQMCRPN